MDTSADTQLYRPEVRVSPTRRSDLVQRSIAAQASERRIVTILFIDVAGSTGMAEVLDPEEWAELMSEAFDYMIRPIERYGGTVTRLLGDAVLALFGAPQAHGDDPHRAIFAALEIMKEIQPLRERIKRQHVMDFKLRAGINTGLVVVGEFGTDELVEYTAMGDAINVAARLEQLAEPGTIRVGQTTYRLTAPYFEYEELGAHGMRGKRDLESSYRVIGYRQDTRWRAFDHRVMPFTGRDEVMATVRQAIDELRLEGRGRIIVIVGEAGVGKSRIVDEIISYVHSCPASDDSLPIALLENRINAFDGTRPYAGLQARFRKVFGIEASDSSDTVREKFIAHTNQFPEPFRESAARVIQRVMALDIGDQDTNAIDYAPEDFKAELVNVIREVVRGWNPGGAFMLVGEDYHWIDAASMEILSELYSLLDDRPVIFLCTLRPIPGTPVMRVMENVAGAYADKVLRIDLGPLQPDDARSLVDQLIAGDGEDARSLRQMIVERADGNPLFIEELVLALEDQGALERDDTRPDHWHLTNVACARPVSLPESIQALLLERIDRLPAATRRALQQASVLGRTFNRKVLAAVAQIDGDLNEHLDTLMRLDLIRPRVDVGSDDLVFRHAMIQETAYGTILLRHRRHIHRRAAEALEQLFADRVSEYTSEIGLHYFQAGDSRGVDWLIRAAEQAQAVFEPELVVDYSGKALELAAQLDMPAAPRALLLRGRARDVAGDIDGAQSDLETLVGLARGQNDMALKWEAMLDLGSLWAVRDYRLAGNYLRDALTTAHLLGDDARVAHSLNRMGNWYVNVGDPASARQAHENARAIFERLEDRAGLAETLDLIGLAQYLTADFAKSQATYSEAIRLFRDLGNNRGLSSSLAMRALTAIEYDAETAPRAGGDASRLLSDADRAIEAARAISWRAGESFALLVRGEINVAYLDAGAGIADLRESLRIAESINHEQWMIAGTQALGGSALDLFNYDFACDRLLESLGRAHALGSAYWTSVAVSRLVDWHIANGDLEYAARLLTEHIDTESELDYLGQRKLWFRAAKLALAQSEPIKALEIVERLWSSAPIVGDGTTIPHLALLRGNALVALGRHDAGVEDIRAAAARSAETGYWLGELYARVALVRALDARVNEKSRGTERARVEEIIAMIAGQLQSVEWREAWLSGARRLLNA